jgi:ribose transport system substrate-binding protein
VLLAFDPSMWPFIQQASSQGVPVIVTNNPVKDGESLGLKQELYPRTDAYGAMVAEQIGAKLGGKGTVAITQGGFNVTENLAAAAFAKTMRERYPGVKVLKPEEEGYDPAKAVSKAVSILQANPEIDAAFSTTAGGPKTWSGAAAQTSRSVVIVGMDYTRQNLDLVKAGKVFGLVGQPLYQEHAYAVNSLKTIICGGSVPYAPELPVPLVTKANLNEYYTLLAKTGT